MKTNTSHSSLKKFYRSRERMVHESARFVLVPAYTLPNGALVPEENKRVVTGGTRNVGTNVVKLSKRRTAVAQRKSDLAFAAYQKAA